MGRKLYPLGEAWGMGYINGNYVTPVSIAKIYVCFRKRYHHFFHNFCSDFEVFKSVFFFRTQINFTVAIDFTASNGN